MVGTYRITHGRSKHITTAGICWLKSDAEFKKMVEGSSAPATPLGTNILVYWPAFIQKLSGKLACVSAEIIYVCSRYYTRFPKTKEELASSKEDVFCECSLQNDKDSQDNLDVEGKLRNKVFIAARLGEQKSLRCFLFPESHRESINSLCQDLIHFWSKNLLPSWNGMSL